METMSNPNSKTNPAVLHGSNRPCRTDMAADLELEGYMFGLRMPRHAGISKIHGTISLD